MELLKGITQTFTLQPFHRLFVPNRGMLQFTFSHRLSENISVQQLTKIPIRRSHDRVGFQRVKGFLPIQRLLGKLQRRHAERRHILAHGNLLERLELHRLHVIHFSLLYQLHVTRFKPNLRLARSVGLLAVLSIRVNVVVIGLRRTHRRVYGVTASIVLPTS